MRMEKLWYSNGIFLTVIGVVSALAFAFFPLPDKFGWLRYMNFPMMFMGGCALGTLLRQIRLEKWFNK